MSKPRDRSVLAVDDDPAYLSAMKLCMRIMGFNKTYTATDGGMALAYMDDIQFDLVVSDWNMAPIDGLELLRTMRTNPATARTPFILMSANLSEAAWREAIDLGATEFLIKPFSLSALRSACSISRRYTERGSLNLRELRPLVGKPMAKWP